MYKPGYVLIASIGDDNIVSNTCDRDMPELCVIKFIVQLPNCCLLLVCEQLHNVEYSEHYHAYYIIDKKVQSTFICSIKDLCDHHTYSFHQSFNPFLNRYFFIALKYYII